MSKPLTVKELIHLLGTFDENLEVYLEDTEGWTELHSDCVRFEDNAVCLSIWDEHGNICGDYLMNDSTSKTEYIVTYHYKGGSTYIETYNDYGVALYAAAAEMEAHRESRDWYEVKEVVTITRIIKSTK